VDKLEKTTYADNRSRHQSYNRAQDAQKTTSPGASYLGSQANPAFRAAFQKAKGETECHIDGTFVHILNATGTRV